MTSASELLYKRRYRFGRNDVGPGFDTDPSPCYIQSDPINRRCRCQHRHHHHHHPHCDNDGRDYHHPNQKLGSNRFDRGSSLFCSEIVGSPRHRLLLNEDRRLPGAVILARERLLQRLRGFSPSGNRQNTQDDFSFPVEIFNELETEVSGDRQGRISSSSSNSNSHRAEEQLILQGKSKPPELSQDIMNNLKIEAFNHTRTGHADCSICLESFIEADELMRLPCGHRFHLTCLEPWLQSSRKCPYCRTGVISSS